MKNENGISPLITANEPLWSNTSAHSNQQAWHKQQAWHSAKNLIRFESLVALGRVCFGLF